MDILKGLNDAMAYIESHLTAEMDLERMARIAGLTKDGFSRFFSYMTGMTLKEYIRRRRLTQAACELQDASGRILDVAVKYGWESADAFTKAFKRQHGVTPTQARDRHTPLRLYPPAAFDMVIKGAQEMDFRLIEIDDMVVYGISRPFDRRLYPQREDLRHVMWSQDEAFVPGQICEGYDGIWYGIWRDGRYMLAREKADTTYDHLEKYTLPGGAYAAFKTERGGFAWEELPRLFELIFDAWLPASGYRQKRDEMVEVYHLWTDRKIRRKNRWYEVWIPVETRKDDVCL